MGNGKKQQWFVGSEKVGPFSSAEIRSKAAAGEINPDDSLWRSDSDDSILASQLKGLTFGDSGSDRPSSEQLRPATPASRTPSETPVEQSSVDSTSHEKDAVDKDETIDPFVDMKASEQNAPVDDDTAQPAVTSQHQTSEEPQVANSTETGSAAAKAKKRKLIIIVASAALGLAFLIGTPVTLFAGWYFLVRDAEPAADPALALRGEVLEDAKEERAEIREDIDDLKKEADEVEDTAKALKEETQQLERQKQQLENEIQSLTEQVQFLKSFPDADFVMYDANGFLAVDTNGGAMFCIAETEGDLAKLAVKAARKQHIPRFRNNPGLIRNVVAATEPGGQIDAQFSKRISDEFWKVSQYVPDDVNGSTRGVEFAMYRDAETFDRRLGFCVEADRDGMEFFDLERGAARVAWNDVIPGTARRGRAEHLMNVGSEVDFLDYCVLEIARSLGQDNASNGQSLGPVPTVLVHTNIDIPEDHLRFYESLDQQLLYEQQRPRETSGSGLLGILGVLMVESYHATNPMRRKSLRKEMLETDPYKRERALAVYLEDEVLARLSDIGVSALSDTDARLIEDDHLNGLLHGAALHDATHLASVTLKPAKERGDYHLSVRLFREDGRPLWAAEGDRARTIGSGRLATQYHIATGQPAVLRVARDHRPEFMGEEIPAVVPGIRTERLAAEPADHLVYLLGIDDESVRYRTLFSGITQQIPVDLLESHTIVQPRTEIPETLALRHAVRRIATRVIPAAGQVLEFNGESAVVGLGRRDGVAVGDQLRVIRRKVEAISASQTSGRDYGLFAAGETPLPTELVVTRVDDDRAFVSISETGFENQWSENVALKPTDLVATANCDLGGVVVEDLELIDPVPRVAYHVNKNRVKSKKYADETIAAGKEVTEIIRNAFRKLQVPAVKPGDRTSRDAPPGAKITHRVTGTVTVSPDIPIVNYALGPRVTRVTLDVKEIGGAKTLDEFEFDLGPHFGQR